MLEMAVVEMVHAEPLLPLGDLLQRLEALEGRLGPGGAPHGTAGGGGGRPAQRVRLCQADGPKILTGPQPLTGTP